MGGAPMWRGIPVCSCLLPLLNDLASGTPTLPRIIPTQGSWSTSVSASAQTHAGGGVLDISLRGWSSAQVLSLLVECRRRGLVAWSRTALQGFAPHVHAVMDGCEHLSGRDRPVVGTAAWQVAEYRAGRNGLAGRGRDDGPRDHVGVTWWTYSRPTPSTPKDDTMTFFAKLPGSDNIYLTDGLTYRLLTRLEFDTLKAIRAKRGWSNDIETVPDLTVLGKLA